MILGFFDPRLPDWPLPRVRASVRLQDVPGIPETPWFGVTFLVDTGATRSCLHPIDAVSGARIPMFSLLTPELWPVKRTYMGVGGAPTYFMVSCTYEFHLVDGEDLQIEGEVGVGELRPDNRLMPSLLGWDVLQKVRSATRLG